MTSKNGVQVDAKRVKDMLQWPRPIFVKQLRGFLGFIGYYRKLVKGYSEISKPLCKMLQKGGGGGLNGVMSLWQRLKH